MCILDEWLRHVSTMTFSGLVIMCGWYGTVANIDTIDSGNTEISIVCPAADMLQINGSSTTTHSGNLFQEAGCLLQRKQWDQVWELAATHPPPYIIMAANIIFCYDSRYPNDHSSTAPKFRLLWWPCKLNTHVHTVLHSNWCLLSSVPHSPCFTRDPSVCPGLLPPHYKISGHWCLRSCLRSPRSKFCWKYLLSWWAEERTTPAPGPASWGDTLSR